MTHPRVTAEVEAAFVIANAFAVGNAEQRELLGRVVSGEALESIGLVDVDEASIALDGAIGELENAVAGLRPDVRALVMPALKALRALDSDLEDFIMNRVAEIEEKAGR